MGKEPLPENVGVLEALGIRLREMEKRAQTEGDAFWESERSLPFEATNFAFLIRSLRSLLLILSTEHVLRDDLRAQGGESTGTPADPGPRRAGRRPVH